jgi:hypothetical protein
MIYEPDEQVKTQKHFGYLLQNQGSTHTSNMGPSQFTSNYRIPTTKHIILTWCHVTDNMNAARTRSQLMSGCSFRFAFIYKMAVALIFLECKQFTHVLVVCEGSGSSTVNFTWLNRIRLPDLIHKYHISFAAGFLTKYSRRHSHTVNTHGPLEHFSFSSQTDRITTVRAPLA